MLRRDYQSPYFHRSANGVELWVPVNGAHTQGSEFPRTELRETLPSGALHAWRYPKADNLLVATLRIDAVPSSRRMVIGQIHSTDVPGSQNDPLLKLQYHYRRGVDRKSVV